MWAVLPFKGADGAKKRLATVLTVDERRHLAMCMARDVLGALCKVTELAGILIVSRAPEGKTLAEEFGAETFAESGVGGLAGALQEAGAYAVTRFNATGTLIVHGDVPNVTVEELNHILDSHQDVTIAPDEHDIGTNALACSPPNRFEYVFDGQSFAPHVARARAAGIEPRIVRTPGIALDIDTVDDLMALLATDTPSASRTYLDESGIATRLRATHNQAQSQPERVRANSEAPNE